MAQSVGLGPFFIQICMEVCVPTSQRRAFRRIFRAQIFRLFCAWESVRMLPRFVVAVYGGTATTLC